MTDIGPQKMPSSVYKVEAEHRRVLQDMKNDQPKPSDSYHEMLCTVPLYRCEYCKHMVLHYPNSDPEIGLGRTACALEAEIQRRSGVAWRDIHPFNVSWSGTCDLWEMEE